MNDELPPLPSCASCGAVAELTIQWKEEEVSFLRDAKNIYDKSSVKAIVPVWTCHICGQSYTDGHAEIIRQNAVNAARLALI
jgi:hypothetical protein